MVLRVVCEGLPEGFGVDYLLKADGGRAIDATVFEYEIRVVPATPSGFAVRGACVKGPKGGKFLYLVWQRPQDLPDGIFGRIKVPLDGIAEELASAPVLVAVIAGTGRGGKPAGGRARILSDWQPLT